MQTPSSLPIYLQLSEFLAREIAAGHLLDGQKLPPERDMAVQLGTSVGTLRKALDELTKQGLLRRRHGAGNFVCKNSGARGLYAYFRIELLRGGGLPNAKLLSVERVLKPNDLPSIGTSIEAHRIRRMRSLNGIPCMLEEVWLDGDLVKRISARDVSESLYLFYRERLNMSIAHVEDQVSLGEIPDWTPKEFPLTAGARAGYFERIGYMHDDEAVEHSKNWFDTSHARYVARFR